MEDMGLKIFAGVELIPPVLCFVLLQNAAKDGNARDWEQSLTAQAGMQKDPQAPAGHRPAQSGLSVCLPGESPPSSGSDREDSYGRVKYLSVSITRLCRRADTTRRTETITGMPWSPTCFRQLTEI